MQPGETDADFCSRMNIWRQECAVRVNAENLARWEALCAAVREAEPALEALRDTAHLQPSAVLLRYIDALSSVGRELLAEYDDRASQFGFHSDGGPVYLWRKHEDCSAICRARRAFGERDTAAPAATPPPPICPPE